MKRLPKFHLADHRGYIVNGDTSQATGQHFTPGGRSIADQSVAAIKQMKKTTFGIKYIFIYLIFIWNLNSP